MGLDTLAVSMFVPYGFVLRLTSRSPTARCLLVFASTDHARDYDAWRRVVLPIFDWACEVPSRNLISELTNCRAAHVIECR